MEIATRNVIFPGSVGLVQAHPLTKPLAMGDGLPPDLVQLRSTLHIRALVLGPNPIVITLSLSPFSLRNVAQIRGHKAGSSPHLPPNGMCLQCNRETTSAFCSRIDSHRIAPTHAAINRRLQQLDSWFP